jgi:sterol desaturase/sphingolipid hydroxylase (fatty acid hydroxylase superfamily)
MSLIVYAIPLFLSLMALEMLAARLLRASVVRFHDAVTSIHIGFVSELFRSVTKLVSVVVYATLVQQAASFEWDPRHPAVWIVAFFLYDFFYYWAHRCGHEINLLWASHVVHHSSEDFNLSTAMRQSWTNQVFYWIFYLPMAIVGIPVEVFVVTALASAVYQFWVHTRLIRRMGWMDRVFVTPSNHRVHHGRNAYCIDRNYGGTLILWDRLFGTYAAERDQEPVVFGTLTPLRSWSPVWANFKNYLVIASEAAALKGWRARLHLVFAPPGAVCRSVIAPPPLDAAPYETPVTGLQKIYGTFALLGLMACVLDLLLASPALDMRLRLALTVAMALATVPLAWVFEGRRGALGLEAVRCILMLGPLAVGTWYHPVVPPMQAAAGIGLVVSLVLLTALARRPAAALPHTAAGVTP